MDCTLDLESIAAEARNAEFNPTRFAAVILREPKTKALVFASGKLHVRIIQKLGFPTKFKNFIIHDRASAGLPIIRSNL